MEYQPDPRHAELIVKFLNLESAKGVTTPSVKKRLNDVLTPQLDALQTRKYRSVVMRAAYLSQGQARSVILNTGIGEQHAETDGTIR